MPVFDSVKGARVFIPAHAVVVAEAPTGLTTIVRIVLPGTGIAEVEVKGTCDDVAAAILHELKR